MKKGQFFLIGSILFIGIITGVLFSKGSYTVSEIQTSSVILKQGLGEFPKAINALIIENGSSAVLKRNLRSYMRFEEFYLKKRGFNTKTYFLVGVPVDDSFEVVVGNFYGGLQDLNLSLNGDEQGFSLGYDNITILDFENVADFFEVQFNFTENGDVVSHKFTSSKKVFYLIKRVADFQDEHFEEIKMG